MVLCFRWNVAKERKNKKLMTGGAGLITNVGGGGGITPGGRGSGDILSTLAIVNELEKQGTKISLPNSDCMVESFTNIGGDVTLHSDYTGGSMVVLTMKIGLMKGYVTPFVISDNNNVYEIIFLSELVSGASGAWTYNIAQALNNNYTTANGAKITNYFGNVSGNQLVPSNGNTSAMFIKTLLLSKMKDGTVEANINFNTDVFPADVSILNTNILKFSSSVDVKENFKDNDYVVIFKKSPEEDDNTVVLSSQNPQGTGEYAWFVVQLNADTTYSSPDITASFDLLLDPATGTFDAGYPNVGDDETGYYAMKLTAFLDCIVGSKEETTIQRVWPKDLIINILTKIAFTETFTYTSSMPANSWTPVNDYGTNYGWVTSNGYLNVSISNQTNITRLYRNKEDYILRNKFIVKGAFQFSNEIGTNSCGFSIGSQQTSVYNGSDTSELLPKNTHGITVVFLRYKNSSLVNQIKLYNGQTIIKTISFSFYTDTFFSYICEIDKKSVKLKVWATGSVEPDGYNIDERLTVLNPGNYFMLLSSQVHNGNHAQYWDNISVETSGDNMTTKYQIPNIKNIEKVSLIGTTIGENNQILSCNGAVV